MKRKTKTYRDDPWTILTVRTTKNDRDAFRKACRRMKVPQSEMFRRFAKAVGSTVPGKRVMVGTHAQD